MTPGFSQVVFQEHLHFFTHYLHCREWEIDAKIGSRGAGFEGFTGWGEIEGLSVAGDAPSVALHEKHLCFGLLRPSRLCHHTWPLLRDRGST